jgi:hypothetical protein
MKLLAITFSGLLLLTGCSSSSSPSASEIESQVKVVEYQNCLNLQNFVFETAREVLKIEDRNLGRSVYQTLDDLYKITRPDSGSGEITFLESAQKACEKYRP